MNTGYFANARKYPADRAVSIALYPPKGWTGRTYPPLYPSPALLADIKNGLIDEAEYERQYLDQLNRLDPLKVQTDLGKNAILVCYERPESFCHRHIVAAWLGTYSQQPIIEM